MSSAIRANLDPFNYFSDSMLWEALEIVKLKSYVASLVDDLNTEVSDNSIFSAGQKQLLWLARAILRKNNILVLDEATANVDLSTDAFIQKIIKDRFKHCTILTIAHRLATLKDSDLIIVMEDGLIKDQGTPKTTKYFTNYNNIKYLHAI